MEAMQYIMYISNASYYREALYGGEALPVQLKALRYVCISGNGIFTHFSTKSRSRPSVDKLKGIHIYFISGIREFYYMSNFRNFATAISCAVSARCDSLFAPLSLAVTLRSLRLRSLCLWVRSAPLNP